MSRTLIEDRLSNQPLCPRCGKGRIVRWGSASKLQRYRCQDCKVTFNALTSTSLARWPHKDKWLCYSQQLSEGRSICLCTDNSKAMGAAARKIGMTHHAVNLAAGIRVVARVYHVQNVNAYGIRLKNRMHRFHGVATRYLPSYLGWRRIVDETKDALTPMYILRAALGVWGYQQQLART